MIYWRIKHPGKSWRVWDDGTSDDEDEAKVDALYSVLDDDNQLREEFRSGATVEMFECIDMDDLKITPELVKSFRKNYLGVEE